MCKVKSLVSVTQLDSNTVTNCDGAALGHYVLPSPGRPQGPTMVHARRCHETDFPVGTPGLPMELLARPGPRNQFFGCVPNAK